ncbi:acyltransferase [Flavobacterium aquidurense]|uniref:acyltransferase family protein n=1 Tax=Flavobacterium aquidurense TaxID=362413 RepID=UPI002861E93A|nr:acyltransferase [Flavobacterium aquidurense]MDR7370658.1 peptidoglycan/LPS O-acetylase OafA/YrhL [Flavobacterium aquidurense]
MNFTISAFLFPILIVLILSVLIVNILVKTDLNEIRHPEIDGLRGYLAFFVFLHHSYIWQVFLKTKNWEDPESNLFNQFGETTVVFFFIITAFLFTSKLIHNKTKEIDWSEYLKSRFFRLFPMYFFSIIIVFILVAILTQFKIRVSAIENMKSILSWIFFNVSKNSNINGLEDTFILNSGITWTLPYEWAFYFLLPIIALFFKIKINFKALLGFTAVAAIILVINKSSLRHFMPFVGGISVALLNSKKLDTILKQKAYTVLAIVLLAASIYFFNGGRKPIQIIIASIVFLIIASGNNFFGILSSRFSRKFGQITYSLYLLHGILLFIIFYFIIGFDRAKTLTNSEFWLIITASVFPLILICQLTFKYIELPLMAMSKRKKIQEVLVTDYSIKSGK